MIGHRQIIVNGFGNSHKANPAAVKQGIIGKFLNGIHGVISPDIEEIFNLQFVQDLKDLVVKLGSVLDLRQLVTAGTQKRGRSPFQQVDIQIAFDVIGKIHYPFFQQPLNAVKHSIDLIGSPVYGRLIDSCKTGIDHRSGSSGLPHDDIAFH